MSRVQDFLLPLGVYLGVSLAIPALNGAWRRSEFWSHASVVAGVALGMTLIMVLAVKWLGASTSTTRRKTEPRPSGFTEPW